MSNNCMSCKYGKNVLGGWKCNKDKSQPQTNSKPINDCKNYKMVLTKLKS